MAAAGCSFAPPPAPANPLIERLHQAFSGYRLPAAKDRFAGWANGPTPGAQPYACTGDFNGDGRPDEVTFILNSNKWKLIAFLSDADGQISAMELTFPGSPAQLQKSHRPQDFIVSVLKKGERVALSGKPRDDSVHSLDSILLSFSSKKDGGMIFRLYPGAKRFSKVSYDGFLSDD